MKNVRFSLLLLLLCGFTVLSAQTTSEYVSESKRVMSRGALNSYLIEIPDVSAKSARASWEEYIKTFRGKSKYDGKSKELVTTNAVVPAISNNGTVTMYVKFMEDKVDPDIRTNIIFWFEDDAGFIDSDTGDSLGKNAIALVEDYLLITSKQRASEILADEQSALESMEKELKKLREARTSDQKELVKSEQKVSDLNKKLTVNTRDIADLEKEIIDQKLTVSDAEESVRKYHVKR